jgi:hypothetical protein
MLRRAVLALPVAALALLAALPAAGALAQTPDPEGPQLVYQSVKDGDKFNQPVFVIQLCFAAPINNKDLDKGGDFAFDLKEPDGFGLGHGDVFQPNGYGISIYPGNPPGETVGEWTFKYRVTTPDAQHATEGTITYTVDPAGETTPRSTPPACVESGGTPTASPTANPNASPTSTAILATTPPASPSPTATKAASPGTTNAASPTATEAPAGEGGGGPDIGTLAFLTIGAAGIAALIALVGYFIRRRVGFDLHKPGSGNNGGHH